MAFFPFRMYSRKGVKLRQYPESKLKAAYDAVKERGISQGKAAKEFEVYIAACQRGGVSSKSMLHTTWALVTSGLCTLLRMLFVVC